jgi:hypothetical protein
MHIRSKSWQIASAGGTWRATGSAILLVFAAGCAAPGTPLPPTLNLPQVVSGTALTASRVGGEVRLRWTTPSKTTDKLPIKGAITAEICRDAAAPTKAKPGCSPVGRVQVEPGASEAADLLPSDLAAGQAKLLAYRIQLVNSAGRTAGPSPAAYAVSGPAPAPVDGLSGELTRDGVELRWHPEAAGGTVELDRTLLDPAKPAPQAKAVKGSMPAALSGAGKEPAEMRFRAGDSDAGGTVDRTVAIGHSYRYTVQRVVQVQAGGQTLEARSIPSAELQFAVRDVFPPSVPQGLVAVPAMAGATPAIELAWDADVEPRVAGYRVYRREDGSDWKRIGPDLVTEAAYSDSAVTAGRKYWYRVTAVSTAGNESAPSGDASETASALP